ncbi:MAG TPA: hypothetical protein VGI11_04880 [Variovorax sp.]|jgi:hypothetical protein
MERLITITAATVVLSGCAQTNYEVYEGRGGSQPIVEGVSGTRS